jgi:hypothetical protein
MSFDHYIRPFNNLDDFLTAAYILVNYNLDYGNHTLLSLINRLNGHKIDEAEMNLLKSRLNCSPNLYGVKFLSNSALAENIDSILNRMSVLSFSCKETQCSFCNSILEGIFSE